jgi:hypothetical protein
MSRLSYLLKELKIALPEPKLLSLTQDLTNIIESFSI